MSLFYKLLIHTILFSSLRMLVGGYSSLYLINHGLTIADISFLKAFQGVIIVCIQIPIGVIIDKYKNRFLFILISIFLAAIWLFLTGIGNSAFIFYIAEAFNALSLAIFNAAMLPILVETYTHETGRTDYHSILGRFFKYQNLFLGGSVIIGSMFVTVTSRYVWIISAVLLVIIGLFSIFTGDLKKFNFTKNIECTKKISTHMKQLIEVISAGNIASLFVANIALITLFQMLAQFWQIIIYEDLNKEASYALVYGLIFAFILGLQAGSSYLAEKRSSLFMCLVFLLVMFTSTYFLAFEEGEINITLKTVLFLSLFFLYKYPSVIISSLLHKNINNDIRATFDSIISTFSMGVSILIFYIVGIFLHQYGSKVILLSLAGLSISALCFSAFHLYRYRNTENSDLLDHPL